VAPAVVGAGGWAVDVVGFAILLHWVLDGDELLKL
jgi:hypothetical protein